MAKNKNKVQEQGVERTLVIEPKLSETKVEVTDAMDKAQELLQIAVNEVMEDVLPLGELLNLAKRKLRRTSVITEKENEALDKLHVEVEVRY